MMTTKLSKTQQSKTRRTTLAVMENGDDAVNGTAQKEFLLQKPLEGEDRRIEIYGKESLERFEVQKNESIPITRSLSPGRETETVSFAGHGVAGAKGMTSRPRISFRKPEFTVGKIADISISKMGPKTTNLELDLQSCRSAESYREHPKAKIYPSLLNKVTNKIKKKVDRNITLRAKGYVGSIGKNENVELRADQFPEIKMGNAIHMNKVNKMINDIAQENATPREVRRIYASEVEKDKESVLMQKDAAALFRSVSLRKRPRTS